MSNEAGHFNRYAYARRVSAVAVLAMAFAVAAQAGENPGYDRPCLGFSGVGVSVFFGHL